MKIDNILKNDINIGEKDNFAIDRIVDNIHRGKIMAVIVIGIESVYVIIDIITSILKVDNRFSFNAYLAMYLLMIMINVLYLLAIRKYHEKDQNIKNHQQQLDLAIIAYITFVMSWGSIVSLMDQALYGQLMTFMVNVIVCSAIYLLDNKKILIPYAISVGILSIGLPFFQSSSDMLIGHYVNLVFFIIISWLISRIIYHNYCENYTSKILLNKSNLLLEKKIEENRKINIQLALANNQLKKYALLDELTGIPNRRSFREFIDMAFEYYVREGSTLSIIMMDIDFFKQFNDYYGHEEGDRTLIAVANQINSIIEDPSEIIIRWGGEEFLYAAFNQSPEAIAQSADKIIKRVADLKIAHDDSSVNPYITISMGVGTIPITEQKDLHEAIDLADQALYLAKSSGRNCIKTLSIEDIEEFIFVS